MGAKGRERDPARDRPSQTVKGMTDPLDPYAGATPNASGSSARISVSSLKGDIILGKSGCSAFIISIYPN